MAIYDLGTASLAANGEVTGVGTTWKAPLTLIRVGATIVFKTEPVQIYTISEIISDTQVNVYNPNSETVPAGTGYAILAHDGITVQGLAQDVAETLRYYQSRETEVADAVEAFNNFDSADFESKVSQVNTQYGDVLSISSQVSSDASQVYNNLQQSISSANSASDSALRAENAASELSGATIFSFSTGGVVNSKSQQVVLIEGESASSYLWSGDLPKVVPQDSSPESTGGVGLGAWIQLGSSSSDQVADVTKSVFSGGAKLDGVTNDLGAFIACANFASANKVPVYFPPFSKMKISGPGNVVLTSGAMFNGSTIDISEYAGQIRIQRQVAGVTYDVDSSLITNIRNGLALTGYYWPSVVNNSEIENCYLNIVTTQPYYTYRGKVVNRTERLISVRHGIMDGILRYPLTGNLVSSIVAYKLPATWIQYSDVNFKVGMNQLQNSPVYVEADMVQLKNWTLEQTNGIYTTANPLYVTIRNSSRVIVENFNTMWTNRTSSNNFTYIIACEYSCDVKFINCRGVGDGWGMTGFNENRKVVFDGCNLSRIDSHQPFIERLDIINCQISQHGIHFTALADVNIEGGSINLSNDPVYTDKVGFITLRDECGGMADGWLNISNLSLSNRTSTATQSLVLHRGSALGAPPPGSPVNFRCFSSVNVNGLKSDDRIVNVMPQVNSASGAKYPESVTVTNCQEGIYSINADISANTPANALSSTVAGYTTNTSNLKVTVNNVNVQSNITLIDTSSPQRWQCDVSLIRLIGGQSFNPGLLCKFGGVLSISHSIVEGFDFYSGTALDRYLRVNVTGGAVRHTGRFRTVPFNGVNSMVDITFNGVHCEASSLSQLRVYAQAYLCGCSYSISGSAPTRSLPMTDDGSVSTDTGVALINTRNSFVTTISVSGKLRRAPFYLPQSGGSSYVQLDNGVFANVEYSGSTITVTTTGGLGNVSIV